MRAGIFLAGVAGGRVCLPRVRYSYRLGEKVTASAEAYLPASSRVSSCGDSMDVMEPVERASRSRGGA
jgi:hypothetical protein